MPGTPKSLPVLPGPPLLISPTLVWAEGDVPTGLLGALGEGSKLAAEGGVGTGASPLGLFQGEGDAGSGFPVGPAGRVPVLGAELWVQHSQRGPSGTIGAPVAYSHQGDRARSQESTADSEGRGLGGLHLNLHPHLRSPCGIWAQELGPRPGSLPHPHGLCLSLAPTHQQ